MPLVPTADPATTTPTTPQRTGRRAPKRQGRRRSPTGRSALRGRPPRRSHRPNPSVRRRCPDQGRWLEEDHKFATTRSCGRRSPRSDRYRARRHRRCWRPRPRLAMAPQADSGHRPVRSCASREITTRVVTTAAATAMARTPWVTRRLRRLGPARVRVGSSSVNVDSGSSAIDERRIECRVSARAVGG